MVIRYVLLFGLLTFLVSSSIAQENAIRVNHEYDQQNEEFVISADNFSSTYYTVVIKFNKLYSLSSTTKLPAIKIVPPGTHRLFKLEKSGTGQPDFSYVYAYWKGVANPKIEEVAYTLPFSASLKARVKEIGSLSEFLNQDTDDDYYSIGFSLVDGDTILASRKGVIEAIEDQKQTENLGYTFTRDRNYIRIRHDDGTIANYWNFKNSSSLVDVGTEVLPGTPLAIAAQTGETGDALLMLSFFYLVVEPSDFTDYKEWDSYKYFQPKFAQEGGADILKDGSTYSGFINDELVTQEMSRRQKKKYLSNN
ncbi:MAG: hypothetical protein HWE07_00650 [Cytophagia bacterium]|nr:hypothetical protein [Cytophagia bacterium]